MAQLRTLLHAKRTRPPRAQHNTHGGPGARARTSVADNSHPVIFDCGPLMLGQRHLTHSSVGLGPPGATLPPATGCQRVTSALQNKHRNLSARDSGGGKNVLISPYCGARLSFLVFFLTFFLQWRRADSAEQTLGAGGGGGLRCFDH